MSTDNEVMITDKGLIRLCLDDGFTFVTVKGDIRTSNINAPKLDDILCYVKALPSMTGKSVTITQTTPAETETIMEVMSQADSIGKDDNKKTELGSQLLTLCQAAIEENASDIHIEVHRERTRFLIRVDGDREVLTRFSDNQSALRQPREIGIALTSYIFSTLGNKDAKLRDPANDRFEIALHWDGDTKFFEWRAALIPLNRGIKLTLRCLTPRDKALVLADMDLPAPYLTLLQQMIQKRNGGIVVCGPVGSGKSSLVNALLMCIDSTARSIHAMEDPVEFEIDNVCKTTVEPDKEIKLGTGIYRDYAFYTKETLRHDVDVALLGEVRDHAAALQFCRKGEVGGLALTTLHTNSAIGVPQTFIRSLKMPAAVIGAPDLMLMFVHVKLVKKLCDCALLINSQAAVDAYHTADLTHEYQERIKQVNILLPDQASQSCVRLPHPYGCEKCKGKGEKGRLAMMEIIILEDVDRQFIANEDIHGWKKYLADQEWPDIRAHALSRIKKGQVDMVSAAKQIDSLLPVHAQNTYKNMRAAL